MSEGKAPSNTPRFRGHSRGHWDTSGAKGPKDCCMQAGGARNLRRDGNEEQTLARRHSLGFLLDLVLRWGKIANRQSLAFSVRGQLSQAIPQFHVERILHE